MPLYVCLDLPPGTHTDCARECYVFAIILGVTEGFLSDRWNLRAPFFLLNCALEILGVCLLGFAKPSGVRYFGAFFIIGPAFSNIPFSLTYQANNILGQWKRAFCSATIVGAGGIGGIIGSLVFRSQDAPAYRYVKSEIAGRNLPILTIVTVPGFTRVLWLWCYVLYPCARRPCISFQQTRRWTEARRSSRVIRSSAIHIEQGIEWPALA